jgi:hypothetical protein
MNLMELEGKLLQYKSDKDLMELRGAPTGQKLRGI